MKTLLTILLGIFTVQYSHASFLVEPYLSYESGTSTTKYGATGSYPGQELKLGSGGSGFGARLGYSFARVFLAADYSSAYLKNSSVTAPTGSPATTYEDLTHNALAFDVGVDLMMFRPYLGYVFDDQVVGSTGTTYGTGFKLGLGYRPIPKLTINLEYFSATYTKTKSSAGTETTFSATGGTETQTASGFNVTVSMPFYL